MPRPRTAIVSLLAALFFSGRGIGQETDLTQGAFRNPPPSHTNAANSSDNERQVVPEKQPKPAASDVISFDEVMARVAERERDFNDRMQRVHPIIETYIQNLRDVDIGPVPISDRYFLGKLDLGGKTQESFKPGDDSRQSVRPSSTCFPNWPDYTAPGFWPPVSRRWSCWTPTFRPNTTISNTFAGSF